MVMGLPGSGKSYFASRLAKQLDAVYLSSDSVRKDQFPNGEYGKEAKRKVYIRMAKMAEVVLPSRQKVVIDATFHLKEFREIFTSRAQRWGCTQFWIMVEADETLIKQRVGRPRKDSDADYKVYQLLKREFEALEQPYLKLTSTDQNLEEMLEKAMAYLSITP